ncbi:MAG TPA: 2-hydroxyglutaryl-CoA dehydratase [Candidatus Atribacteria bacterium]|jgi:predicted CoA-substrate-specific enzyme activase|nr:2-hydroxyglutaryl-CoA dehydratase [Candidatus Atribacteria bacterium]
MIVAGLDIGSLTIKVVILEDDKMKDFTIIPTGADINKLTKNCLELTLKKTENDFKDLSVIVATGYGRINIPFAHKSITEITCHALGANWLNPDTRTVIDIGGQDSKVISVGKNGRVVDFVMNDKCAAGTGRFLEVMAQALGVRTEELGEESLKSRKKINISSMCTVFAESEVISLMAEGCAKEDIIRGLHEAISNRICSMANRLRLEDTITLTGGVAKNIGMVKALKKRLKVKVYVPDEPQIVGALGAAITASRILNSE